MLSIHLKPKKKETKALVEKAINESETDLGFLKVKSHYWTQIRPISFDYSILQDSDNLVAIEYEGDWTDLGDWNSVWNLKASDNYPNNAEIGNSTSIDCQNTLLVYQQISSSNWYWAERYSSHRHA